jgi:hypothetical protein
MLQIIFTFIPLWSALIAIVFLPYEAGLGARLEWCCNRGHCRRVMQALFGK